MSSSFGVRERRAAQSARAFWRFRRRGDRHGDCVSYVIMSVITRPRNSWFAVFFLAAVLVVTLGSDTGWPAMGGGHGGGGHGGFSGGRGFESGGSRGRPVPHDHDRDRDDRRFFVFPYFDDPDYWYDPYYPDNPYYAYCDPGSPYYDPQYCG